MITEQEIESILTDPKKKLLTSIVLAGDFQLFIKYTHFAFNKVEFVFKPFHLTVINKLQAIAFQENEKRNLALSLPVGAGKSIIVEYFIAWTFCRNINLAYLYTSHNRTNIMKLSREVKDILQHPFIKGLFGLKLKDDEASKINWSFDGAINRTGLVATTTGSGSTGADSGNPGVDGYSGAIICFPFDELVWTEKGRLKIGEIVENKLKVKVFSFNHLLNRVELQPIDNFIKNGESDVVEIAFDDNSYIRCTPDHKVYTINRGYVEARLLLESDIIPPNPFKLPNINSELFANFRSWSRPIKNNFKLLFRKFSRYSFFVKNYALCKIFPRYSFFNSNNSSACNPKFFSNYSNFISTFCNLDSLKSCQFTTWSSLVKWKCSMTDGVLHIIRLSAVFKITQRVIKFVAIKMPNFNSLFLNPNKSPHESLMNRNSFSFPIPKGNKSQIALTILLNFYYSFFECLKSFKRTFYNSFLSFYVSKIGYAIISNPARNRFPNKISFVGHFKNVYCLTVRGNHNLYVGNSQATLVKNCDDPIDSGEIRSQIALAEVIRFYDEKLATRRRTPTTPSIVIMQRLCVGDLIGWLKETQPNDWDFVEVPAIDEDGKSFWPERYPVAELETIRRSNPSKFYAQYQQNPIADDGTAIFKKEGFNWYEELPKFERVVQSWDTAFKVGTQNDYSVCTTWGIVSTQFGENYYLINVWRGKAEYPQLKERFLELAQRFNPFLSLIEDKASGQSILQDLRQLGNNRLEGIKPDSDKISRAAAPSDMIARGLVYLPYQAAWLDSFMDEMLTFPNGANDDQCDSVTQFLNWANKPRARIVGFNI